MNEILDCKEADIQRKEVAMKIFHEIFHEISHIHASSEKLLNPELNSVVAIIERGIEVEYSYDTNILHVVHDAVPFYEFDTTEYSEVQFFDEIRKRFIEVRRCFRAIMSKIGFALESEEETYNFSDMRGGIFEDDFQRSVPLSNLKGELLKLKHALNLDA